MLFKNLKGIKNFDIPLLINMILLILYGVIAIKSATLNQPALSGYWLKQLLMFVIGTIMMSVVIYTDYNYIREYHKYLYIFNLIFLVSVRFIGSSRLGAQRWIAVGGMTLQPSEFAKLIIIITLAHYIDLKSEVINQPKELIKTILYVSLPMIIIMVQPDLGTSLVFLGITIAMLFAAGVYYRYFLGAIGAGIAALPIMWFFVLRNYQKKRILVFLHPSSDTQKSGYHVTQSKIAIGSGRIFGKGLFKGGFTQANYLPERQTDFIMGVIGEELGFIGTVILVVLFVFLLFKCLKIANEAKDLYGKLLCTGVVAALGFQVLVNMGMTMGIIPVVGIPLPFISSGGSSLWVNMMCIGLVLNVGLRKKTLKFLD